MAIYLLACIGTLALTPLARIYAQRAGLLDVPDSRRLHRSEIARGGGIAMVTVFLLAAALSPWLPGDGEKATLPLMSGLFIALMAGLGFWDDHQPIAARWRATGQVLLSISLLALTWVPFTGLPWPLAVVLATVALVWWINLFNFMDGSNGIAAIQALLMGSAVGVLGIHSGAGLENISQAGIYGFLTAAVALGFLPWNFPRARIFMGDVGSYGLAAMLAVTALRGMMDGTLALGLVVLLPAVFVVDATATLVKRVANGQRWYDAHREHLYQRLAVFVGDSTQAANQDSNQGSTKGSTKGSTRVALGLVGVNVTFIWPAVSLQRLRPEYSAMIVITVYLTLLVCWLLGGRWLERKTAS